jgi:kynureninase
MDPLLKWRSHFPSLEKNLYMISHSLGAMPVATAERLAEYASTWESRSIRAWEEGWFMMPLEVGDLIGRIIGAGPGQVITQPNVSIATWIALSCLDWPDGRNRLVTEAMNFPTNLYIFREMERLGARLVKVPSPDGIRIPVEDMLAAIDEQTRLVAVSHVLFRSSYVQDLAAIVERAHSAGALVLADLYQSAGSVPVNVTQLRLDFATGGSVKWLCGGPGVGYLYVRPDLATQLRPRLTGWMAHRNPFAFEDDPIEHAGGMMRFAHGTPAIPSLCAARSGFEIIAEVGVERIREKSLRQTSRLMSLAGDAGIRLRMPRNPAERGGVVTLDVPQGHEVTNELLRKDVLVDYRPGAGIRVAPHFYTTDAEVDEAIRQVVRALDGVMARAGR